MNTPAQNHSSIFISGPFSEGCLWIRELVQQIFPEHGIQVLQKQNSDGPPVAELIPEASGILHVYGTTGPAIQDVWGRSLVVREFEYAAQLKKPSAAILLGFESDVTHLETHRLRAHLRRQLADSALIYEKIRDTYTQEISHYLSCTRLMYAHKRGAVSVDSLPDDIPLKIRQGLADPNTFRTTLAHLQPEDTDEYLSFSAIDAMIEQITHLAANWDSMASSIVTDQVFLSYSRRDIETARRLTDFLTTRGFNVWRDESRIGHGEPIKSNLLQGVSSSGTVIVLVSADSAQSEWVDQEVQLALMIQKQMGWVNFVLPLQLDNTPENAIPLLADLNHMPLHSDERFDAEAERLARELDQPRRLHAAHER